MAKRYDHVAVSGTANVETTETLLRGTEEEPKHVEGLYVTETTGTAQNDATLRVYRNQQRLVDLPIAHLLTDDGGEERPERPWLPLDLELAAGDELSVGHVSGGTPTDLDFGVRYTVGR